MLDRTKGMMISSGDKAVSQIVELDQAMDQLSSGNFVLGEYHFIMAVYGDSQAKLSQNVATTRAELSNAGFVSTKEDWRSPRPSIRSCRPTGATAPAWPMSAR